MLHFLFLLMREKDENMYVSVACHLVLRTIFLLVLMMVSNCQIQIDV